MNFRITVLFALMLVTFSGSAQKNGKICRLQGTIADPNINSILLLKHGQDIRHDDFIQIPVKEGRFEYETTVDYPEVARLFLDSFLERASGAYTLIFLEGGTINLTICKEEEFEHNIVEGGKLNREYQCLHQETKDWFYGGMNVLRDSMDLLYKQDLLYSEAMKNLLSDLRKSKPQDTNIAIYSTMDSLKTNGLDMTPQGRMLSNKQRILVEKMKEHTLQYIRNNTSIVAYALFLQHLQYDRENIDASFARQAYRRLSEANPNHPYNAKAKDMVNALTQIRAGNKYVDFSAPDMDGTIHRFADLIDGKVALLNLWATWCGPCIAKSKTLLPLYEAYKDKGFTVIAIAGEYKSTTQLEQFMEREQWSWPTLVDLDRKQKIWQKYGVDNKAGALFLIDKDGTILAIDPTAEEVNAVLTKKL